MLNKLLIVWSYYEVLPNLVFFFFIHLFNFSSELPMDKNGQTTWSRHLPDSSSEASESVIQGNVCVHLSQYFIFSVLSLIGLVI